MARFAKRILLLVAVCALAALLAACSGGGNAGMSVSSSAGAETSAGDQPAAVDASSSVDAQLRESSDTRDAQEQETSGAANASAAVSSDAGSVSARADGKHLIGVAVYDNSDSEVQMFKQYLVDYIAGVGFDDVQFVYSPNIESEDDILAFIDSLAEQGGEGLMSFYNIDLAAEVERCASHGMYHMVASGTVANEDFVSVADNDYFLGVIGPMVAMEYNAGANMAWNYIANKVGDRYFIMSGGAGLGNEMHYQRTFGMLDTLETAYGVDLGNTKELAAVGEATTIETDKVSVTISPGYVALDDMRADVEEAFDAGEFDVVLSALPVDPIIGTLNGSQAKIAQVDCYSQDNQILFNSGKLNFLVGKYGSIVGPSFAAMYNAVTGHAADFRADGKAFQIVQNFWSSADKADFDRKYEFASNMTTPAYNLEDLYSVCAEYNPSATLDDLVELASASSFEEAQARRS